MDEYYETMSLEVKESHALVENPLAQRMTEGWNERHSSTSGCDDIRVYMVT